MASEVYLAGLGFKLQSKGDEVLYRSRELLDFRLRPKKD